MATTREEIYMKKFSEAQEQREKLEASNAALAKENENLRMQLAQPRASAITEEKLVKLIAEAARIDKGTFEASNRQLNDTCRRFIALEERLSEFCDNAEQFCSDVSRFKESVTPISLALTGAVKTVLESTDIRMSPEAQADIDAKAKQITDSIKVSLSQHADSMIRRMRKEDESVRLNATFFYIMVILIFILTAYFGITAYCNFSIWRHPDLSSVFWRCAGIGLSAIGVFLALKHFFTRQR